MSFRIDAGTLKRPEKQSNGWLRVDGHLTRVGVFSYTNPDGTRRNEYRPEEEVMRADSLASFQMVPVTNDHPPVGLLDSRTAKTYSVGSVGESVRRDGEHVAASMMVTDSAAIEDILKGKSELSCGYSCDLEWQAGTHNGQRYDAIQRNIRGNHVAIVSHGRAGDARLRLDGTDAAVMTLDNGDSTMKMKISGVEVDVPDTAAQLFEAERADSARKLAEAVKRADTAEGLRDAEKARADAAEKARIDASDPKTFDARVNARVALVASAREVLGPKVTLDDKTDREVHEAMLLKLVPTVKLDGKSDDYVTARLEGALESRPKTAPFAGVRRDAARVDAFPPKKDDEDDEDDDKEEKAKDKMRKDSRDAWRAPAKRAS